LISNFNNNKIDNNNNNNNNNDSILTEITREIYYILFYYSNSEANINQIIPELIKCNIPQIILEKICNKKDISFNNNNNSNNEEICLEKCAILLISNFIYISNTVSEVFIIYYKYLY
jgi:hypothetical protein